MSSSMASEHLQLLIAGYVLGDLDAEEFAEFEQLLDDHPAIGEEVRRMQRTLDLSYAPPEITPPPHLRAAILSAAQAPSPPVTTPVTAVPNAVPNNPPNTVPNTIPDAVPDIAPRQSTRRSLPWNRIINVAAAATIVALGVNNYRLWQALQVSQAETQRLATIVYSLQATPQLASQPRFEGDPASATIAIDPNRLEAVLTVENLPPLPPGQVYALWTVVQENAPATKDAKDAILTEVFNVDAQGRISQSIAVPRIYRSADLVTNVAVSIEDAAAPQKHQGKPVLMANL